MRTNELVLFALVAMIGLGMGHTWHPVSPDQFHVMPHVEGHAKYAQGVFNADLGLVPEDMASGEFWAQDDGFALPLAYGVEFTNLTLYAEMDYWDGSSRNVTVPAGKSYTAANSRFFLPVGEGVRNITIYAFPGFEAHSQNSGIMTGVVEVSGEGSIINPKEYYDEVTGEWAYPYGRYWSELYHHENIPADATAIEIIDSWDPGAELPLHRYVPLGAD